MSHTSTLQQFFAKNTAGILLCLAIAIPAWFLGKAVPVVGGPVFSILIGMIVTLFLKKKDPFKSGITFVSKKVLQCAVVLLGFGLNLTVILQTGKQSLPIIVGTICTALLLAAILRRAFRIPDKTATLIGVGSSICGGSAIAAAAPVIGADDEEVAQSISVIFFFNVLAALIFPAFGTFLDDSGQRHFIRNGDCGNLGLSLSSRIGHSGQSRDRKTHPNSRYHPHHAGTGVFTDAQNKNIRKIHFLKKDLSDVHSLFYSGFRGDYHRLRCRDHC